MHEGYFAIEDVLQKRREQSASVVGKTTPFRVEFRFRGGTKHFQYFETHEAAEGATSRSCRYDIMGNAIVEHPTSQQTQIQGKRGGWKKYSATGAA